MALFGDHTPLSPLRGAATPRDTSMIRRLQPIETTAQGSVWAVSDPLAGVGGEGGMVGATFAMALPPWGGI